MLSKNSKNSKNNQQTEKSNSENVNNHPDNCFIIPITSTSLSQQHQQQHHFWLEASYATAHHFNKPKETIVFFDWDETLLPSAFLNNHHLHLNTPTSRIPQWITQQLTILEATIISFLTILHSYTQIIYIITNSESGWVHMSCQKFLPRVLPYLEQLCIISARSTFEHLYHINPANPNMALKIWKASTFQHCHNLFLQVANSSSSSKWQSKTQKQLNIISMGDSVTDRDAAQYVFLNLPNTWFKSIKFAHNPTIEQLDKELKVMCTSFHSIHEQEQNLDQAITITITITK